MRFRQLDQIAQIQPGVDITAVRTVSDREAYFQDHFPNFAVMPGVLTLEAMFQACSWLVRKTDELANPVVLLKEVANVKFAGLVRPGQTVTVSAAVKKQAGNLTTLVAKAEVDGTAVAGGRLVLERCRLADLCPARAASDVPLRARMQEQLDLLQSQPVTPVVPSHFRWLWIDRFVEFVAGQRSVAVKTVSMTDEPIDFYMPGYPVMPCSLIVEGLAQTGGVLVGACEDFSKRIVLAKVSKAVFHRPAVPGDKMVYTAEIESLLPEGAVVRATSRIDGEAHADVDLVFAYLDERTVDADLIGPADLLGTLRLFGLYDVARTSDGSPLPVPPHLLDAERAANQRC